MIATVVIIVITLLNVIVYKLRQLQESNHVEKSSVALSCRRFSFAEIQSATNNFDEALVLGKGGFGKVYKGIIDNGATTVAIKRLNPMSKQGPPEFWREIDMLSKIRHSHIVSLVGYCNHWDEMMLVYEYMVGGTIADHLHKIGDNSYTLSWVQRLKICIGAAQGLDYLHTGTGIKDRVIHRDVKSSNILLDESWAAKISDFGLSKIGPANQLTTHVSTHVKGSFGYFDPEYFLTRRLTRKSDVYAFGVVLFEVLCGRPAIDLRLDGEQRSLARWARRCIKEEKLYQIIDPDLRDQILPDSLLAFQRIADQSLHNSSKKRPTMAEVVVALEHALTLQERRDSSMLEEEIFNDHEVFDNQENVGSYIEHHQNADSFIEEQEVINAGNDLRNELIDGIKRLDDKSNRQKQNDEHIARMMPLDDEKSIQSRINPSKTKAIMRMSKFFFLGRARGTSGKLEKGKTSPKKAISRNLNVNIQGKLETGEVSPEKAISRSQNVNIPWKLEKGEVSIERELPQRLVFLEGCLYKFDLDDLLMASGEVLGKGTFGVVYKVMLDDGTTVVVKRLKQSTVKVGNKEFEQQMKVIANIKHRNVVQPMAYYYSEDHSLVIYDYYSEGSIAAMLHSPNKIPLNWEIRTRIAIGAARGIACIHVENGGKLVHGNIKASNIFLNSQYSGCVSDLDFSLIMSPLVPFSARDAGYRDPEVRDPGEASQASDVYSFGVFLLELLTGKSPVVHGTVIDFDLVEWVHSVPREEWMAEVFDVELLRYQNIEEQMVMMLEIALACVLRAPEQRPKMEELVDFLTRDSNGMSG